MKSSLFYLIFGGLIVTVLLQSIMFASTGIKLSTLQKQINDLDKKFETVQTYLNSTQKIITKINSFIDEPLPDDGTSNSATNPDNLLSPENLNKTLGI